MMPRARKLVTMVGAPGSAIAMNAEAEAGRREKQLRNTDSERGKHRENHRKNGEAKRNPSGIRNTSATLLSSQKSEANAPMSRSRGEVICKSKMAAFFHHGALGRSIS